MDTKRGAWRSVTRTVPLFCGIFSFLFWFVLCPVLWSLLPSAGWPSFWFQLYFAVAFLVWLLVMLLSLVYWQWHRHREFPCERPEETREFPCERPEEPTECTKRREYLDTPRFPTKVLTVQPRESPGETGFYRANIALGTTNKDNVTPTTRSIPVQPRNSPSLHGIMTDESSTSCSVESVVLNTSRKQAEQEVARVISIQTAPEAPRGVGELTTTDDEESEQSLEEDDGWCRPTWGSGKLVSEMLLVAERRGPEWEAEDGDFVELRSGERLFSKMDSRVTIGKPSETLSPLHELPPLNDFDDYLHLVDVEPPLSPREVFFSDLIQQAQRSDPEGAAVRKSYCEGDSVVRATKPNYKHKSMPLFLYTDDYKQEMAQVSSGHFVSFEREPDGDHTTGPEVEHKRRTVSFEDEEEGAKIQPRQAVRVENDHRRDDDGGMQARGIKRSSVSFEDKRNGEPSKGVEPMFLREVRRSRVSSSGSEKVSGRGTRPGSTGEYFIAAVSSPKSVTSEVHLNVDDSPARKWQVMVSDEEAAGKFAVIPSNHDLSPLEDDSVFH